MQTYLLSVLGASLVVSLIGIFAPNGSARHIKLISSLFLICVLIAPLPKAFGSLRDLATDLTDSDNSSSDLNDYHSQMQDAVNSASRTYFAQTLTQMLERQFSVPTGEIRCLIRWTDDRDGMHPQKITVILSGSAIWKNPAEIEQFVTDLLGCPCDSAIE